jgi:hypothetical protein
MSDVGLVVGKIEGFRAFVVRLGSLWSVGYEGYEWTPDTNRAHCDRVSGASTRVVWVNDPESSTEIVRQREIEIGHGRIPSPYCTCGFWLYKSETNCREHFPQLEGRPRGINRYGDFGGLPDSWVMGRVQVWGRAIEGTDGYRAEFAKVVALVTDRPGRFASVLERYGADVTAPRSKSEEGLSTAWITKLTDSDPVEIKLDRPPGQEENEVGTFAVDRSVNVPPVGSLVTVTFETRGHVRWVTEFRVHPDETEEA